MTIQTLEATPFIGRGRELTEVREALSSASLVTLVGAGGAGKTRLALRILSQLAIERFPGRTWFIELAEVTDPALVELTVAEALGLQPRGSEEQLDLISEFLDDRPALLLLDNCEHVHEAVRTLVTALLARCPAVQVLATSRARLRIRGEIAYRVPPLTLPSPTEDPAIISQAESVQLFVDRAQRALPEFRLTPSNADAIARLCIALDGLPLALELAAAQIPVLGPGAILDRLQDRFVTIHVDYADLPERHRSLEACIDWSYELCGPRERLLWSRLSVFSAGFGLAAAEEICSGEGLDKSEVLEVIAALVERSVIVRELDQDPPRYRMLSLMSEYAARRLADSPGGADPWRLKHAHHFAGQASRIGAEWVGPDQPRLVDELEHCHANFTRALETLLQLERSPDVAVRAVCDLQGYWLLTGQLGEARHWLTLGLAAGVADPALRVRALTIGSFFAASLAESKTAWREIELSERLLAELPEDQRADVELRSAVLLGRATCHLFGGEAEAAADSCHQLGPLVAGLEVGTTRLISAIVSSLAYGSAGRAEGATAEFEAAMLLCDGRGEFYFKSFLLWSAALGCLNQGEVERAEAHCRAALALKIPLSDRLGSALVFEVLAAAATAKGDALRGATLLGAAQNQWRRVHMSALSAPYIAAQRELGEKLARDALPDRGFNTAYRAGQRMELAEAHGYALREAGEPTEAQRGLEGLTSREREVAHLVSKAMTNQQIADELVISLRTAQGHVENILRKLGLTSRTQVAAFVLNSGRD